MASLMETLMDVLEQENEQYGALQKLSITKKQYIIAGNLEELSKITEEEQDVVGRVNHLESIRQETMNDIANVLNKDVAELKLVNMIEMLDGRPEERKRLAAIHDKLQTTIHELRRVNVQNQELLQEALEMVQFEMNLIQASRTAPETANYSKGAYCTGSSISTNKGNFDAKQ